MTKLRYALVLAILALAGPVMAQEDDGTCRNGLFPEAPGPFRAARVSGTDRLYLLEDMHGCPNETPACRQRTYVLARDMVLIGRAKGAYVCAFFPNRGGGSAGWVRRDRVDPLPPEPTTAPAAWTGAWKDGDNTIDLKAKGTTLVASGDAYWPSANPPLSLRPGGPNVGEFGGTSRPIGGIATFKEDDCIVKLERVGPWLLASDNKMCGGNNVSFTGVYGRK
jgi:hypothetical protein